MVSERVIGSADGFLTHLLLLGFCFDNAIFANHRRILQSLTSILGWIIGSNILPNEVWLARALFETLVFEAIIE
jgi:hypothetical protein